MSPVPDVKERTEVRDGMRITWQQPIPADVFGGKVTLYAGGGRDSYFLLPIIPTP